jgi:LIVCS family branched-chain amino acid:cation transporter
MKYYLGDIPLWAFSLGYSLLVFGLTCRKNRVINILGKILTPWLLLILAVVFVKGLMGTEGLASTTHTSPDVFKVGLSEGYNTQDLVAAFFFSSSIIAILTRRGEVDAVKDDRPMLRLALRSSVIGIVILAVVYLGLLYLGAAHAPVLEGISKDHLLPSLVRMLLGEQLGFVAALAISLACLTTSVALALVFTDFLRVRIFKEKISHAWALGITSMLTYATSLLGFAGISSILSTAMEIFYPLLIVLIVFNCGQKYLKDRAKKKDTYREVVGCSVHSEI